MVHVFFYFRLRGAHLRISCVWVQACLALGFCVFVRRAQGFQDLRCGGLGPSGLVTYPLKTQKSIVSPPQAPKPYSLNSLSTERPQALIPEPKLHNPSQRTWEAIGRQKYSNLALNLRTGTLLEIRDPFPGVLVLRILMLSRTLRLSVVCLRAPYMFFDPKVQLSRL